MTSVSFNKRLFDAVIINAQEITRPKRGPRPVLCEEKTFEQSNVYENTADTTNEGVLQLNNYRQINSSSDI